MIKSISKAVASSHVVLPMHISQCITDADNVDADWVLLEISHEFKENWRSSKSCFYPDADQWNWVHFDDPLHEQYLAMWLAYHTKWLNRLHTKHMTSYEVWHQVAQYWPIAFEGLVNTLIDMMTMMYFTL